MNKNKFLTFTSLLIMSLLAGCSTKPEQNFLTRKINFRIEGDHLCELYHKADYSTEQSSTILLFIDKDVRLWNPNISSIKRLLSRSLTDQKINLITCDDFIIRKNNKLTQVKKIINEIRLTAGINKDNFFLMGIGSINQLLLKASLVTKLKGLIFLSGLWIGPTEFNSKIRKQNDLTLRNLLGESIGLADKLVPLHIVSENVQTPTLILDPEIPWPFPKPEGLKFKDIFDKDFQRISTYKVINEVDGTLGRNKSNKFTPINEVEVVMDLVFGHILSFVKKYSK